jgi:hypothetical protein
MHSSSQRNVAMLPVRPLAAIITTVLGLAGIDACAATVTVTNCNDSGVGSLRQIVASVAKDGDTVDMSGLTSSSPGCGLSTISLHTGAITIAQNSLSLIGPGQDQLRISGKYQNVREKDRILNHTGGGEIQIIGLRIENGYVFSSSASQAISGGCVKSAGYADIVDSTIAYCLLKATGGSSFANGGGIYAADGVTLSNSAVIGSTASTTASDSSGFGGGVYSIGPFAMNGSTIAGNTATTAAGAFVTPLTGGDNVNIINSTISGNYATADTGGIQISGFPAATTNTITNSTIANNSAAQFFGGVLAVTASLTVQNSTIAFNTVAMNSIEDAGAGLSFSGVTSSAYKLRMESTIVSNNTVEGVPDDLEILSSSTPVPAGFDNLVYATHASLPSSFGPPQGTCPLLGPLANNGGLTQTLALLSGSPALAQGNDAANLTTDQRGLGFSRTSTNAMGFGVVDIGAYEVQRNDVIFNAGFDGCS